MTAILALNLGDCVVMMSDTASVDPVGRVGGFHSKMHVVPAANTVLSVQGPAMLGAFLDHLERSGRPFQSAADLWERLGPELRVFHTEQRHTFNPHLADRFSLILATCSEEGCRLGTLYGPWTPEDLASIGKTAFAIVDHAKGYEGTGAWIAQLGSGQITMPREFLDFVRREHRSERRKFVAEKDGGTAIFEALRRRPFDWGYFGIGGWLEEITISAAGASSRRIDVDWSDRIGQPIQPRNLVLDATTGKALEDSGIGIVDEDDMASNSATKQPTQQSVKAYVDANAGVDAASQAEQETGTEAAKYVAPATQHHHTSAAKCWGNVTVSSGTPTLQESYNVTSITDAGVGKMDVIIGTNFSSASYAAVATNSGSFRGDYISMAAGSVQLRNFDLAGAFSDPTAYSWALFGDQ